MIVTDSADGLVLRDIWNFRSLSFATDQLSNTAIRDLEWIGKEHVVIASVVLRSLAGDNAKDEDWQRGFHGMLAYAASQGWVDDGGRVRMHVTSAAADQGD